ncbi:hypothetical protein BTO04_11170 [Polaribacter sp. SA4-10]|uniref:hypothetical protein n=1 Tax=Polaribacter sp. SA4-10 TaxID=754397 RepID=UPI000B3D0DB3|nr:hypothetical protein [Polaribacter sp. SA4-10]ARV07211.1 hypothetical protein BTO04_11170 [Polaribacter sp. SA4-10]
MFLQILPADNIATVQSVFENELLFVVLGLSISVFIILKIIKVLSKIKLTSTSAKPGFSS